MSFIISSSTKELFKNHECVKGNDSTLYYLVTALISSIITTILLVTFVVYLKKSSKYGKSDSNYFLEEPYAESAVPNYGLSPGYHVLYERMTREYEAVVNSPATYAVVNKSRISQMTLQ